MRQRQATKDAAELAGTRGSALLNEPTAAAVACGLDNASPRAFRQVYDLGGGTFDISDPASCRRGVFEVLSTNTATRHSAATISISACRWVIDRATSPRRRRDGAACR